jgi:uncharacterized protein
MRAVVDTNVLVSAALKDESQSAIAVRVADRHGVVLKSIETERQLFDVLGRPYLAPIIAPAARDWLLQLFVAAELVKIVERIAACRDPTDDKFLELAISGRADVIVTGDADLPALDPLRNIPIVTPAGFVRDHLV